MSILHVLKAMDPGTKILVTEDSMKSTGQAISLPDMGFMEPQEVTIMDKTLEYKRRGYILRKGQFPKYKWIRDPRKFLNMLDYQEDMLYTEGKADVGAYGRGLVTTMLRKGSNVSRIMYIVVGYVEGQDTQSFAFRAFEVHQLRDK